MNTQSPPRFEPGQLGQVDQFDCVLPREVKREFTQLEPKPKPFIPVQKSWQPKVARARPLVAPSWALPLAIIASGALVAMVIGLKPQERSTVTQALPTPLPTPVSTPLPPAEYPTPRVERARLVRLPDPPRAELVTALTEPDHWMTLPWGEQAYVRLLGSVATTDGLPLTGNHIGDAFQVGNTTYAWLVAPGQSRAAWIDP